jgi:branched-chain amino acid transport system permease protein
MTLEILGQVMVNGLFLGGIYALVACGLTLIYGVMLIINFAHGEFMMVGMYLAYWAFVLAGVDPYLSLPVVAVILFAFGVLIQRGMIAPVLGASPLNQFLLTLGLSSLIIGLVQFFWRSEPRFIRLPYAHHAVRVGELILNMPRLIVCLASAVVSILVYVFLKHSKTGKAIRACSQSKRAASLMGVNVKRIYGLTFGIGVALTGIAGVLLTPSFPMTPTVGQRFTISAFVVVVVGTMGNFVGALVGALIIGLAESFGGFLLGPDLKQVVSMVIFILVLVLRPRGLFGGERE